MSNHNQNAAPVFVSVYNRDSHLRACVKSLQANEMAKNTVLFISSDGPANEKDKLSVDRVRRYITDIKGFKSVELFMPDENTKGHIIYDVKCQLFSQFDRMIRLEDDIVVAPNFLKFMNDSLDFFEPDLTIYSICSYVVPTIEQGSNSKFSFTLPLHTPWGHGIWKDRWESFDPEFSYGCLLKQREFRKSVGKIGYFLLDSLWLDNYRIAEAEDARVCGHMIQKNMVSVYPPYSMVNNIGMDGTGMRAGRSNRFEIESFQTHAYQLSSQTERDECRLEIYRQFMDRGGLRRLGRKIWLNRFWYVLKHLIRYVGRF